MRKMFLFFSHCLIDEQMRDASITFDVQEFAYLPPDLQAIWSNIPPHLDSLSEFVLPFVHFLEVNAQKGDIILVQGDFGATNLIVQHSLRLGLVPVYATTKRVVLEDVKNGEVVKTSIFKHVKFRRYE